MHTVGTFIKIISIPDEEYFCETTVGCTASYFVNEGLNSTCLFLMEVRSDRGCKFRNARSAFRNLHPLSLHTVYLHEKQTSRIQSLYLYFIKIVPFWLRNIRFLIQNTRSLFYGRHYSSLHRLMSLHGKLNVKIFHMFIVAENTRSVDIIIWCPVGFVTPSSFEAVFCFVVAEGWLLLFMTSGDVPWYCMCSTVVTSFFWTCHVSEFIGFRTPLSTSILLSTWI